MHNLISFNQLAGWLRFEKTLNESEQQNTVINEYFDCLIECDESQHLCKKYCSCLLYTSPSPRDATLSRMPSSA